MNPSSETFHNVTEVFFFLLRLPHYWVFELATNYPTEEGKTKKWAQTKRSEAQYVQIAVSRYPQVGRPTS